jgi:hypothetical protein
VRDRLCVIAARLDRLPTARHIWYLVEADQVTAAIEQRIAEQTGPLPDPGHLAIGRR